MVLFELALTSLWFVLMLASIKYLFSKQPSPSSVQRIEIREQLQPSPSSVPRIEIREQFAEAELSSSLPEHIFTTKTGDCYHTEGCGHISSGSKQFRVCLDCKTRNQKKSK